MTDIQSGQVAQGNVARGNVAQGNRVSAPVAESGAPTAKPSFSLRRLVERFGPFVLTAALIAFWEFGVRFFEVPTFLLPTPSQVVRLMIDEWPLIQMHSQATIVSIVVGYTSAVLFALLVSAMMIRFPLVERCVMPIFVALQSVPKIAIAPLILVWVGAGLSSKVLVVTAIAFFPIVINTMTGFKEVDLGLRDVFHSVAATERQVFFQLRLPYAMPYIFAGLRIATTLAVLGAIVAEYLAASNGLGYLVLSGSFNFNTARSFAAVFALAIIVTSFFGLMSFIESRLSWKRRSPGDGTSNV